MFCNEGPGRSQRSKAPRIIGRAATAFSALTLAATVSIATATPVTGAPYRVDPGADSAQEQQARDGKGSKGSKDTDKSSKESKGSKDDKGSKSKSGKDSGVGVKALRHAESKIGAPYRWGAAGPSAFDCSGLVQWSFRQAGVTLKRTTTDQVTQGSPVSRSQLRPGDLVFFYSGPSHVGIYAGDNKMIHAPRPGKNVQIVDLSRYYDQHFHSARRIS
ncbi:C40 family peptidase [Thermobifida cellulosilytica]|uniref:C40 family peptidase n=1 Tax=Thermobifida cellulosilytica TaxID=144786 RepID=UPI000A0177AE|nr:C40 family peptidase [Thermobifida cellulosilytica]